MINYLEQDYAEVFSLWRDHKHLSTVYSSQHLDKYVRDGYTIKTESVQKELEWYRQRLKRSEMSVKAEHILKLYPNCHIIEAEKLKITFASLVIRANKVLELYESDQIVISELAEQSFTTNGELIILKDMTMPSVYLEDELCPLLSELGFIALEDIIILYEELIYGVKGRVTELLNQPIPWSKEANWIETEITMNGNYVWLKE